MQQMFNQQRKLHSRFSLSFSFVPITKLTLCLTSLTLALDFSLGSVSSRLLPPLSTTSVFQDSNPPPAFPPPLSRPLSLSVPAGKGCSVLGEVDERVRGSLAWLWRWKLFIDCIRLSISSRAGLEVRWWDATDLFPKSSCRAWSRAAVSSSRSSHSLLTVSWSNATWRVMRWRA